MQQEKLRCFLSNRLFVTLLLCLLSLFSFSQGDEKTLKDNSAFNRALPRSASKKISKIEKHFNKAALTMDKATNYEHQIDNIQVNSRRAKTRKVSKLEEKKMQKEIEAFYIYQQAHKKLYKIYHKSLKQFREKSTFPDEGVSLEKNASIAYKKSKKIRRKAENKGDIEKAYPLFADANGFEIAAINHQIDAFTHYQSTAALPATEASPEEEITAVDSVADRLTPEAAMDSVVSGEPELPLDELPDTGTFKIDNTVLEDSLPETLIEEEVILPLLIDETEKQPDSFLMVEADTLEVLPDQPDSTETDPGEIIPVVEPQSPPVKIFFTIQILSRTSPATDEQLKQIYSGPEKPYLMKSDGYYRYVVGRFATLFETKVFQNQNQVEGFIVAYKNGEKISVQEAVDLLKER